MDAADFLRPVSETGLATGLATMKTAVFLHRAHLSRYSIFQPFAATNPSTVHQSPKVHFEQSTPLLVAMLYLP